MIEGKLLQEGQKLTSWGKNLPGGHKLDGKMCWVQLLTSTIQFLSISIPENLLHVTMTRREEKSVDIFVCLFAVFQLALQEFDNKLQYFTVVKQNKQETNVVQKQY